MADNPDPKGQQNPQGDPPGDETEEAFWKRLHSEMDTWFDDKIKTMREQGQGRVGRTTLPSVLADFMFGKATDKK